jgi:hypothetical protein
MAWWIQNKKQFTHLINNWCFIFQCHVKIWISISNLPTPPNKIIIVVPWLICIVSIYSLKTLYLISIYIFIDIAFIFIALFWLFWIRNVIIRNFLNAHLREYTFFYKTMPVLYYVWEKSANWVIYHFRITLFCTQLKYVKVYTIWYFVNDKKVH